MKRITRLLAVLSCLAALPGLAQYYGPGYGMDDMNNYTALWYVPSESGWGMNTNHQDNIIFMTLFTYAEDGQPMWLVGPAMSLESEYTYSGKIYRTSGPPFNQTPWSAVSAQEVGTMSIYFVTTGIASVTYTYNGVSVSKAVMRQEFSSPVPECRSVSGSRMGMTNYQDLWYNPSESGWGINITHQGNTMFATLFTYSPARRDMWMVGPDVRRQADGSYAGALYTTRGPVFNASPWTAITPNEVGGLTLRFADGEHGTLVYSVNGTTVTKSIQRQVFGGNTPVCY